jgi:hypothetical protein
MRRLPLLALIVLAAALSCASVAASPRTVAGMRAAKASGDLRLIVDQQAGGRPYRIAAIGTMAYVAQDRFIRALDAHAPSAPLAAGRPYSLPAAITSLTADGPWLYAATYNTLYVLDARNPGDLIMTGVYTGSYAMRALAAQGTHVYAGADGHGVLALDVSDPANPQLSGEVLISATINDLAVSGTVAYAAIGLPVKRLYALDLASPGQPVVAGTTPVGGEAYAVALAGHYAYVTTDGVDLRVIDVLTPGAMRLVGSASVDGASYDVYASGAYAYLLSVLPDNSSAVSVIDARVPATPTVTGRLSGLAGAYGALVTQGVLDVLVADREAGRVWSVDVSVPGAPRVAGAYAGPARVQAAALGTGYALAADYYNGLRVLDLDDPSGGMVQIGAAPVADLNVDVALSGTRAYLASGNSGVHAYDVSNPHAPQPLGTRLLAGPPTGLAPAGTLLYVTAGSAGLRVLDTTNPAQLNEIGAFAAGEWLYDVAAGPRINRAGRMAYLAGANWVHLVDVTAPSAPVEVGRIATDGFNSGIAVNNSLLYVANTNNGLMVYDVTWPGQPVLLLYYPWPGINGVAVSGPFASLSSVEHGVLVLDMTSPAAPVVAGRYVTPGTPAGVSALGGRLLIADGEGGVSLGAVLRVSAEVLLPGLLR